MPIRAFDSLKRQWNSNNESQLTSCECYTSCCFSTQLHAEMAPLFPEQESKQVVDARHRFAKKRFDNEYRWEPTQKIEAAIINAVFEND